MSPVATKGDSQPLKAPDAGESDALFYPPWMHIETPSRYKYTQIKMNKL